MERAVANETDVWWRPEGRSPFSFNPEQPLGPQIFAAVWQLGIIFGGPLLALVTINKYPFLIEDRTLYIAGLASIAFWFCATFVVPQLNDFPNGMPQSAKLAFRVGFGLCMTGLLLGIFGIVNGYATPLFSREASVVAKHQTLERDPGRRTNYIAVRVWPGSRDVVELGAPWEVYDRLAVPLIGVHTPQATLNAMPDAARVNLVLGKGRLGWEWLKGIEPR
jgi:hypothetical protein